MQNSPTKNSPELPPSSGRGGILLGILLLTAAFTVAGALPASGWALGGFLCFFTLGITLIVEGWKKKHPKTRRE